MAHSVWGRVYSCAWGNEGQASLRELQHLCFLQAYCWFVNIQCAMWSILNPSSCEMRSRRCARIKEWEVPNVGWPKKTGRTFYLQTNDTYCCFLHPSKRVNEDECCLCAQDVSVAFLWAISAMQSKDKSLPSSSQGLMVLYMVQYEVCISMATQRKVCMDQCLRHQ